MDILTHCGASSFFCLNSRALNDSTADGARTTCGRLKARFVWTDPVGFATEIDMDLWRLDPSADVFPSGLNLSVTFGFGAARVDVTGLPDFLRKRNRSARPLEPDLDRGSETEFHSWTPLSGDPSLSSERLLLARILSICFGSESNLDRKGSELVLRSTGGEDGVLELDLGGTFGSYGSIPSVAKLITVVVLHTLT